MRVLVTGCESSGTSLVSRILLRAGASIAHRSATYEQDWPDLHALARECGAVVVIFRDPFSVMASQEEQGLVSLRAYHKLRRGYFEMFSALRGIESPLYVLTYEQLVLNPDSIRPLLSVLGLDEDVQIEEVRDENAKYFAIQGPYLGGRKSA